MKLRNLVAVCCVLLTSCSSFKPSRPDDYTPKYWINDIKNFDAADLVRYDYYAEIGRICIEGNDCYDSGTRYTYFDPSYEVETDKDTGLTIRPKEYVLYQPGTTLDNSIGVVGIDITDPKVSLYGFNLESDSKLFDGKMKELGYTLSSQDSFFTSDKKDVHVASKKGYKFFFIQNERINIQAPRKK